MSLTRRQFSKLAAVGASAGVAALSGSKLAFGSEMPNSKFSGVQIGAIVPYSYHDVADTSAAALLALLVRDGLSGIELMNEPPEAFAGAPKQPSRNGLPAAGGPYVRQDTAAGPRAPASPEQRAKQVAFSQELTKWRVAAPMSKFAEFGSMYKKAGVSIYAFKLSLTMEMPDEEFDYAFNVTKALGANHFTMELPSDPKLSARVGAFATKHKTMVGYHFHTLATPTSWDEAMSQSPYNGINIDVGHYVAAGNTDVLSFLKKHHHRITSIHLKDRKSKESGGANVAWGQGNTPVKEILQLMKKEQYKFPGSIELEYSTPGGSTCEKEIVRCVDYCKAALES